VCEEAVELLVAGVFQGPSSTPPPASRISGECSVLCCSAKVAAVCAKMSLCGQHRSDVCSFSIVFGLSSMDNWKEETDFAGMLCR
jgi:hypothetical protein